MNNRNYIDNKGLSFTAAACLILLFLAGCSGTYVRDHPVENNVFNAQADIKGVQKNALDYFEEKYPPKNWAPAEASARLAIGPILISREALVYLEGDRTNTVSARTSSGTGNSVAVVESNSGRTLYFLTKKESYEAQALITEALANEKRFKVFSLDQDVSEALQTGKMPYEKLSDDGIRYLISGNITADDGTHEISIYLRMIDTSNMHILCATSFKGSSIEMASRGASQMLVSRLSAK